MSVSPSDFGELGQTIANDAWNRDLDAKIVITSHNSRPGLGKTTLAIWLARALDKHEWTAEEKAFLDPYDYHKAYENVNKGSVLVFDEIEYSADSRRSMSNKNLDLSRAWAMNRYRNVVTICTLPTVSMLDKRMMELSDYWINVLDRGVAHPYRVKVNDFTHKLYTERMGPERNATIRFNDLPDGDDDYEYLKKMKAEIRDFNKELYTQDELDKKIRKVKKDAQIADRDAIIRELYESTDLSQKEIANLNFVDTSRVRVTQILAD